LAPGAAAAAFQVAGERDVDEHEVRDLARIVRAKVAS